MNTILPLLRPALAVAALGLAACGGGGGTTSDTAAGTALVTGTLVSRDGSTQNLGGVLVRDLRTGLSVATAANGSFSLGQVPSGTLGLQVVDPLSPYSSNAALSRDSGSGSDDSNDDSSGSDDASGHDSGDDHGQDDDTGDDDSGSDGDDDDTGDDDCDLSGVSDGDRVEVEIETENGRISAVRFRQDRNGRERGELRLQRAATSDDANVAGRARLESRSDRQRFDVEAENLAPGRSVELVLLDGAGGEESLGLRTVTTFGEAQWEVRTNDGDVLPFGALSVNDLAGFEVEVCDAVTGTLLLFGTLPALPGAV